MRCGAKCFLVKIEINGKNEIKTIIARTPAEARKTTRKKYGAKTPILTVRKR